MAEPEVDQHVGPLLISVRVLNDERVAREEDSVHRLGIGNHLELFDAVDFLLSRAIIGHLRGRCQLRMLVHAGGIELRRDHFRYTWMKRCFVFDSCCSCSLTYMRFGVHFAETFLTVGISPCFEQRDEFHRFSTVDDTAHLGSFRVAFLLKKTLNNRADSMCTRFEISVSMSSLDPQPHHYARSIFPITINGTGLQATSACLQHIDRTRQRTRQVLTRK